MESKNEKDSTNDLSCGPNQKDSELKSQPACGVACLFLWLWNWFVSLPKIACNVYNDIKSGAFLSRFSLLDAMFQFIFAVATSCHPQEESEADEHKAKGEGSESSSTKQDVKLFSGTGRTLRSRTQEKSS